MLPAGSPLSAWLTWLETLSPCEIDLGLERVQEVLSRLDLELAEHVLLIAGTNGKGSSVAMADALLRGAGYRVGAYTSPHVIDYNERISVGGRQAGDADIIAAFEAIEAVRNEVPLTYFEYGTLAAFVVFAGAALDVWILEVGMGGRLDATNVIDPTGVLITNVALDHCDWLGNDIETIAAEKAGVMRRGVPVVYGGDHPPQAIQSHAAKIGARLLLRGRDYSLAAAPQPGLPGEFQKANAAAVLALLEAAGLADATAAALVAAVLPTVGLAGRGQRFVNEGVEWLLDVAHNPAAANVLAATLAAEEWRGRTIAVIGVLDDKDVEGIVGPLDAQIDLWIAVAADSQRALPAGELARRIANACGRPCLVANSIGEALHEARSEAAGNDRILVTGSFYLVGPVLEALGLYSRPQS
ncbi:MAG: bifunctional folylpolyglutamate synthase/dihydrofolate synthase [Gammaproteobacteria bacterium]|nr:bifunctional folylpolyglutamate synthase/dihydrofolate synthase [Gammaproteobacteria bacterium]